MFASADYFALCDMKTVWLNYNFIWNTMAEFHRILRRFLPLSLSSIVLYDIIMFVHDPFFSTFQCGTAAYIHSVACSHVRIISFTNLKWKGNGNGFGLFSALFIIIRTNSRIQSITIMFTDFCTASIHFKTFWYLVKWSTIYHCHMFGTRADVVAAFTHIANNRPTAYVWKSTWTKNTKLFVIYPLWFIPLHHPETRNPKCIHWHTEKMWAKRRDFEVYLNQWRKKQLGKHQNTKKSI